MKRWFVRILIFLLLGAVTTVGVAWELAWTYKTSIRDETRQHSFGFSHATGPTWEISIFRSDSFVDCYVTNVATDERRASLTSGPRPYGIIRDLLPRWSRARRPPDGDEVVRHDYAAGWPRRAMRYAIEMRWGPVYSTRFGIPTGANPFFAMDKFAQFRAIPLLPIWSGFVINTLLYGAFSFALFFGFAAMKRTLRTRRGLCPRCAYDLRGGLDNGCPECGWSRSDDQPPGEAGG